MNDYPHTPNTFTPIYSYPQLCTDSGAIVLILLVVVDEIVPEEALISITPEKVLGANILVRVFWPLWERRHVLPVLPMLVPEVVGVDTTEEEEWGDTVQRQLFPQLAALAGMFFHRLALGNKRIRLGLGDDEIGIGGRRGACKAALQSSSGTEQDTHRHFYLVAMFSKMYLRVVDDRSAEGFWRFSRLFCRRSWHNLAYSTPTCI